MADNKMVTIINGQGERFTLPESKLEQYKKTWEEIITKAEQKGFSKEETRKYEIKEIIREQELI